MHRKYPELIILDAHEIKQGTVSFKIDFKARNVGRANMDNTIRVGTPPDLRDASHLAEHDVNKFNRINPLRFLNAIRNTAPSVTR